MKRISLLVWPAAGFLIASVVVALSGQSLVLSFALFVVSAGLATVMIIYDAERG